MSGEQHDGLGQLPVESRVAAALAGVHAVIDLDRLASNATIIRANLPRDTGLMAVVKANAYGHGLVPSARAFLEGGAEWLGVARIEEGLALRVAGIAAPILILGPPNHARIAAALRANLHLAIGSLEDLHAVQAAVRQTGYPAAVHLKVDTGMHRFGVEPAAALALVQEIVASPGIRFAGLFTHFASADIPASPRMREQAEQFAVIRRQLASQEIVPETVHQANSAATLQGALGDPALPGRRLARCGIALYGLPPGEAIALPPGLRPALQLRSRIARIFTVQPGEGISYGPAFIADRPLRCALVPVGYGDGFTRALSNRGWMSVRGRRCPIRGRICMDQTVIEIESWPPRNSASDDEHAAGFVPPAIRVPAQPTRQFPASHEIIGQPLASQDDRQASSLLNVHTGEDVHILGDGSAGEMTAVEAARLTGTIPYEVVTAIAARVPRLFVRGNTVIALSDLFGVLELATPLPLPSLASSHGGP